MRAGYFTQRIALYDDSQDHEFLGWFPGRIYASGRARLDVTGNIITQDQPYFLAASAEYSLKSGQGVLWHDAFGHKSISFIESVLVTSRGMRLQCTLEQLALRGLSNPPDDDGTNDLPSSAGYSGPDPETVAVAWFDANSFNEKNDRHESSDPSGQRVYSWIDGNCFEHDRFETGLPEGVAWVGGGCNGPIKISEKAVAWFEANGFNEKDDRHESSDPSGQHVYSWIDENCTEHKRLDTGLPEGIEWIGGGCN